MKATKVYFEHLLNNSGNIFRNMVAPKMLQGIDDYFEEWRGPTKTIRRYGTWLRTEHAKEFMRRHKLWKGSLSRVLPFTSIPEAPEVHKCTMPENKECHANNGGECMSVPCIKRLES